MKLRLEWRKSAPTQSDSQATETWEDEGGAHTQSVREVARSESQIAMSTVFRPSIDLNELLLISRNCMKQREALTKQRARLATQQRKQREVQCKLSRSKITGKHGPPTLKISAVIWSARQSSEEVLPLRRYCTTSMWYYRRKNERAQLLPSTLRSLHLPQFGAGTRR